MVHAWVSGEYIYLALMYMTQHIFPVLPMNHLINQDSEPTMLQKLETGTKPSLSNPHIIFFTRVV